VVAFSPPPVVLVVDVPVLVEPDALVELDGALVELDGALVELFDDPQAAVSIAARQMTSVARRLLMGARSGASVPSA